MDNFVKFQKALDSLHYEHNIPWDSIYKTIGEYICDGLTEWDCIEIIGRLFLKRRQSGISDKLSYRNYLLHEKPDHKLYYLSIRNGELTVLRHPRRKFNRTVIV